MERKVKVRRKRRSAKERGLWFGERKRCIEKRPIEAILRNSIGKEGVTGGWGGKRWGETQREAG